MPNEKARIADQLSGSQSILSQMFELWKKAVAEGRTKSDFATWYDAAQRSYEAAKCEGRL